MSTPATSADFHSLRSAVSGTVLAPGDDGWDAGRQAWNLAVDQQPAGVVFAEGSDDVAATVRFAAANGLRVTAQGTGHGAATHDTLADTILIRTVRMLGVNVNAHARVAQVGAGVLAGDLAATAGQHGLAPLGGSSVDVGVVGYTLGGGLGWLARPHGLACNAVRGVDVVTADGQLVSANADSHPDLFWALRGGGGSFGIVTAIEVGLVELGEAFAGDVMYDAEHAPTVFRAFRDWAAGVGDEVTASARFLTPPPIPDVPEFMRGRPLVTVTAAYAGDPAEGQRVLAPLRGLAEPVMDGMATVPAAGLCRIHGDPENPVPGIGGPSTILAELPDAAIDALIEVAGPASGSPLLQVDLRQLGGALSRAPEGAGVLGSLQGAFAIAAIGAPMGPNTPEAIADHLAKVREALAPWSTGGTFLNFHEAPSDGSTHFGAGDYARLREVKAAYDPNGVIRGGQDVAPAR